MGLLTQDPRWTEFVERYAYDLPRFSVEVCNRVPTGQQQRALNLISAPGCRVSISSGHGTGKTGGVIAPAVLWHLTCYWKSNTLITAPKIEQVRNTAWKEIADILDKIKYGEHSWIADYIILETQRVYIKDHKDSWFVIAKTAPKGSPENLAGMHRDWYLVIADEASGIPDANYGVLTGALTDERNRMLLTSQPTRSSGFFYDTHRGLSKTAGGLWDALVFDSRHSPLVSESFIQEKRLQYTAEEFDIKVRGRFPDKLDGFLLGRSEVEKCFGWSCIDDSMPWGWISSHDVGGGGYRDSSIQLFAKVHGYGDYGPDARRVHIDAFPIVNNALEEVSFAGNAFDELLTHGLTNDTAMIDVGGSGRPVAKIMEEKGAANIIRVNWGGPCFSKENQERFTNLRAQATCFAGRAVQSGRLTINCENNKLKERILNEASRIPVHWDEKGRRYIEKKEKMRENGIPSPDIWDTICFLFLEGAYYTSAGNMGVDSASKFNDMDQAAEEAFKGV